MHLYQELGRLLRSPTLNCEIEIPTSAKTGRSGAPGFFNSRWKNKKRAAENLRGLF